MTSTEMDLMRRTTRWVSIAFCSLIVGCLLGMAVAGVFYFKQGPVELLNRGEAAFQAGTRSCASAQWDNAQVHFQEALLSADKVIQQMENAIQQPAHDAESNNQHLYMGKGLWLKYRAMKSSALARQVAAQPADTTGNKEVTDVQKISPLKIVDEVVRRDTILTLREAAYRLPKDVAVLEEAISVEIQIDPLHWDHLHAFTTTLHESKPDDARVLYLMARLAYEQPVTVKAEGTHKTMPAPLVKRSKERMLSALQYMEKLKTVETPLRWRSVYLHAQILNWLSQQHVRNPVEGNAYSAQLQALLFDESSGIDARLRSERNLGELSHFDLTGLLGLHQMALEMSISSGNMKSLSEQQNSTSRIDVIHQAMQKLTGMTEKLNAPGRKSQIASFYLQACLKVMPASIVGQYDNWCKYREHAVALCKQAINEKGWQPSHALQIAELLIRDAQWLEVHRKVDESSQLYQNAMYWVDAGLKNSKPDVLLPGQLALHDAKLKLMMKSGANAPAIQQHLDELYKIVNSSAQSIAHFYTGMLAHREGRLQQAQHHLEKAAACKQFDLYRRSMTQLIPVYLVLEKPEPALNAIDTVAKQFTRLETQRSSDIAWYDTFLRSGKEWLSEKLQAHILAAHETRRQLKIKSADAALVSRLQAHETALQECIKEMSTSKQGQHQSLVQYARYLLQWDCLNEVEPVLKTLRELSTGHAEVLQLEMGYMLAREMPAQSQSELHRDKVQQVDRLIERYLTHANAQQACKLIWIKWLSYTDRTETANRLLHDNQFFGTSPEGQKLKLIAHLFLDNREKANEVMKLLPRDPQLDVALLLVAGSVTEQQQAISSIPATNQNNGLIRTWSAALKLARGDHAEACKGFIQSLEYTAMRPLVRQGLLEAFSTWSKLQPVEARKLAVEGLQHYPSEPSLLLGFAICCQQVGQWGNPHDTGDQVKDMATALKALEHAYVQENRNPWEALWIAANMWAKVDMHEHAAQLLGRLIELNPRHEPAYPLAIQLELEHHATERLRSAEELAKSYRREFPQSAEALYWLGRCAAQAGRNNEALEHYRQLMEQQPRHARVYQACCQLLVDSSNPEAYAACQQVLQRWKKALPDDLMAYQYEIQLAARQGRKSDYQPLSAKLLARFDADNSSAIQTVGFRNAAKSVNRQKADMLCLLTQGLIRAGDLSEAREMNAKAIALCEDHDVAHLQRGDIGVLLLKQEPVHSATRKTLAQQTVAAYAQHYRQHKGHPLSGNNMAWVLAQEMNEPLEAYQIMQEVRKRNQYLEAVPGACLSVELLDTLGIIYSKLSKQELAKEQIELFESAITRYQKDSRVAVHLGTAYLAAQKYQQALDAFQLARKHLPHSALPTDKQRELNKTIQEGLNAVQVQTGL